MVTAHPGRKPAVISEPPCNQQLPALKSGLLRAITIRRPVRSCTSVDRNLYFELKDNVRLYGGFNGTENDLSQRDWVANPCVLSGDIDLDASQANNSFTVVYSHNVSETTIIDGFYIQQGNAEDMSVTFGGAREQWRWMV